MPRFKIIELLVLKIKIVKVLAIYLNGGHLGQATETIFINSCPSFSRRKKLTVIYKVVLKNKEAPQKVVSEKMIFGNNGHIHV